MNINYLDVECPTCLASPGDNCIWTLGTHKFDSTEVHPSRIEAAVFNAKVEAELGSAPTLDS